MARTTRRSRNKVLNKEKLGVIKLGTQVQDGRWSICFWWQEYLRWSCNLSLELKAEIWRTIEGLRPRWRLPWSATNVDGGGGGEPSRRPTWDGLRNILERTDGEVEVFSSANSGFCSGVSDFLIDIIPCLYCELLHAFFVTYLDFKIGHFIWSVFLQKTWFN